ncbi:amino acid adenylation enzyme/thioester reductase family protein [Photorhabdus khanii NC19]|uniref:Amino acid adenylation enzyme/thioester reductase family protein n=1 Tax=Photorhabdus khanii NC19 TaxID=1004151 RepID=W3V1D1_9GAMM|nr:non-ribosomal peptide synthetase [Photorhabdus khanii]ETS29612.1 amino acid adenylation enzyme/thioester reductase family protein [Photorhabdus khanii NC19]
MSDEYLSALDGSERELFYSLVKNKEGQQVIHKKFEAEIFPLSFSQNRLWMISQLEEGGGAYHIPIIYKITGALDIDLFEEAINFIFKRHDSLRSTFVLNDGVPNVRLLPVDTHVPLVVSDLRNSTLRDEDILRIIDKIINLDFDLSLGPLIRPELLHIDENKYIFILDQHHIITDGWSIAIFLKEMEHVYNKLINKQLISLEPLPLQYSDYAVWQRESITEEKLSTQLDYWKEQLVDLPPLLALPTDRPRAKQKSSEGEIVSITIDSNTTKKLEQLSQQQGVTLFMMLMSVWGIVLSRLSGQNSIVIGIPSANRGMAEVEKMIGFFVNTLPIRIDVNNDTQITDLFLQVKDKIITAQDNQDVPFERIVEAVNPQRSSAYTPVFQVMFSWESHNGEPVSFADVVLEPIQPDNVKSKFDLEFALQKKDNTLVGAINYATDLFDKETIERHLGYYLMALESIANNVSQCIKDIDILPIAERELLLNHWNSTRSDFPTECLIHETFERQVIKTPNAPALVFNQQIICYDELNRKANRLAHRLIDLGVVPDSRVVICVSRTPNMVIGLLAILKAGGAYVPLDPAYPKERLGYILKDTEPVLILHDEIGKQALEDVLVGYQCVDLNKASFGDCLEVNPHVLGMNSRHLAYVIYTSGSTGNPKGVQNEHRGVINRLHWMQQTYLLTQNDVVLQKTTFSFDVSVWEFFWGFMVGASMVLATEHQQKNLSQLADIIRQNGVTTLHFVPSVFNAFLKQPNLSGCVTLKHLFCSGEVLHPSTVKQCQALLPWTRLYNLYGPTEAAIDVTYWHCPENFNGQTVPIGKPIANTRIYLLDDRQQPVPLGGVGELYIGGVGVARGYLNRFDLTEQRFVADPFSAQPNARMYRTGDLARYHYDGNYDGNIEYIGRNDHQVKIRGFRIELGEIEAHLESHPAVQESVVIACEGAGGDKRLVAYLVLTAELNADDAAVVLRQYLLSGLPEYMVPVAFVTLAHFPLTPNGKLDRRALPAPDALAYQHQYYEAPENDMEMLLAEIWGELLGTDKIGRHDNFFALGGHSLLVIQLMGLLRKHAYTVSAGALFSTPRLFEQAALIKKNDNLPVIPANQITGDIECITPEMLPLAEINQSDIDRLINQITGGLQNVQDIYGLSPLQDGIMFHHLLENQGDSYQVIFRLAFNDRAGLDAYIDALQQVINRHDILRTAFFSEGLSGGPVQIVLKKALLPVNEITLSTDKSKPFIEQLAAHHTLSDHRLTLSDAPLLRLFVAQEPGSERWLALEVMHHLIGDHTTLDVMHHEIGYILSGRAEQLLPAVPYRNLIAYVRRANQHKTYESYFRRMLADIDEPTAPFGLYNVVQANSQIDEYHLALSEECNTELRGLARRYGVSLASLIHLGWGVVLAKSSGRTNVVTGTVMFGRLNGESGAEQGMGLFINTLPLRLDIDNSSVVKVLEQTHQRLSELLNYEHTPLAAAQRCSSVAAPAPLFTALLNYRHNRAINTEDTASEGWKNIEMLEGGEEKCNYPVGLSVDDDGQSLALTAQVIAPLSASRLCGYLQQSLAQLAWALREQPDKPVCLIDVLPPVEQTLLLETWNPPVTNDYRKCGIHFLFEQQAAAVPDAVALAFKDRVITYEELNRRANRLAHQLVARGVKADSRIAICADRNPQMVMGLLAILKAGGAYVPLDPDYPQDRLNFIVKDAAPVLILHDKVGKSALQLLEHGLPMQSLDDHAETTELEHNPQIASFLPHHLAYVIYTSGSTGRPKGVMVEHSSIVPKLLTLSHTLGINRASHILQFCHFSFDVSVSELFCPLISGATLHLIDNESRQNVTQFWALCKQQGITHMSLPFQYWNSLTEIGFPDHNSSLLSICIGGEKIPADAINRWMESRAGSIKLVNCYGPTETTITATLYCPERHDKYIDSIGRPLDDTRIYLLDKYQRPVPLGAIGEIYIGGNGVSRGYLNQPQMTAEHFMADPFSSQPGARMYKSGDLARYYPDGGIEYIGRNDHQVKIRGFRIELGEIEQLLTSHPVVYETAVIARRDIDDIPRLVAYLTLKQGEEIPQLAEILRQYLSASLPDYMVPSAFVVLAHLPLTPNGKLDRQALPIPIDTDYEQQVYAAPQNELEEILAEIWSALLNIERIGRNDDFFVLGGHSLSMVKLISILQSEIGYKIPMSNLFKYSTLKSMSEYLYRLSIVHGGE